MTDPSRTPDETRPHILYVEDNADMAYLMRERLEWEGFRVTIAPTRDDGFAALCDPSVDLLLLDLMLPDGDGMDLLVEVRGRSKDSSLPVVILSGRGDEPTVSRGLKLGADDFILKAASTEHLIATIRDLLRKDRAG